MTGMPPIRRISDTRWVSSPWPSTPPLPSWAVCMWSCNNKRPTEGSQHELVLYNGVQPLDVTQVCVVVEGILRLGLPARRKHSQYLKHLRYMRAYAFMLCKISYLSLMNYSVVVMVRGGSS